MENLTYIYLNILSKSLKRGYVSHVKSHINLLVYEIVFFFFPEFSEKLTMVGQVFGDCRLQVLMDCISGL